MCIRDSHSSEPCYTVGVVAFASPAILFLYESAPTDELATIMPLGGTDVLFAVYGTW